MSGETGSLASFDPLSSSLEGYDSLAKEYYSVLEHPTSAALRFASDLLLTKYLLPSLTLSPRWRVAIEVGAGRTVLPSLALPLRGIATDVSPAMLRHTSGTIATVANAWRLPIRSGAVSLIISALGDPYNGHPLWQEIARVLEPGGVVMFTTPSFKWAQRYRPIAGDPLDMARFTTASGMQVFTPSLILPVEGQVALMSAHGLAIQQVRHVSLAQLPDGSKAPKLCAAGGDSLPVVQGYVAAAL